MRAADRPFSGVFDRGRPRNSDVEDHGGGLIDVLGRTNDEGCRRNEDRRAADTQQASNEPRNKADYRKDRYLGARHGAESSGHLI